MSNPDSPQDKLSDLERRLTPEERELAAQNLAILMSVETDEEFDEEWERIFPEEIYGDEAKKANQEAAVQTNPPSPASPESTDPPNRPKTEC